MPQRQVDLNVRKIYQNPAFLYDIQKKRDIITDDIPFYLEYAKKQKGTILELGCGTGRVALKLAQEGFDVFGIDLSCDRLALFRQKYYL